MTTSGATQRRATVPGKRYALRESCDLDHDIQIVEIDVPPGLPKIARLFGLRDYLTGSLFPAQRSLQNPDRAFLRIGLGAGMNYDLEWDEQEVPPIEQNISCQAAPADSLAVVSNGKWSVEIFLGEWSLAAHVQAAKPAPTPIRRTRVGEGAWRGGSFLDTREPVQRVSAKIVEEGPLRTMVDYRAEIGRAHFYAARLTFDAGLDFIVIEEKFNAGSGDQIVWDFSGTDLPDQIHILDSTAGFATLPLSYFFDRRLARLACWNQYSQLHDFSDGYALTFPAGNDAVGFVALRGGNWRGNAHNFLEACMRRWFPGDPDSRRLVPAEAKADAAPSPERIQARPANRCEAHFSAEGWIHQGQRSFALVLASRDALRPAEWNRSPPLGHFEEKPDRTRYRQQQSLLRHIHTQHGMFPLTDQLALTWSWPAELKTANAQAPQPPWERPDRFHPEPGQATDPAGRAQQIMEFLEARVSGFWEGSGAAYANVVVCRRLARYLVDFEWLAAQGHLTPEKYAQGRAWFVFLTHLLASDHYYPGAASMNLGDPLAVMEPTIAGMANQNFHTDAFNLAGIAAQVFHRHPDARKWRDLFSTMWRRQLEYHVYPESGLWEESHTYFQHVLATVVPTIERRRDDGVENGFDDPALQKLAASALKLITPKLTNWSRKRHVIALGDHGMDNYYAPIFHLLANDFAEPAPELAAHLAWLYREMNGNLPLDIESRPASWQHEYVQGLGYFFRTQSAGSGEESLFALRCGSSWGHHHNDEGSLWFFAEGRPWIVDSAFGYPQENGARKTRADGHSRWTPRDIFPLNHLWQFNRGWIKAHATDTAFPFAVAFTPVYMTQVSGAGQPYFFLPEPILHSRTIVQLAPRAFLILDRTEDSGTTIPQAVRFHIPCDAPFVLENDVAEKETSGSYLRIRSLFGAKPPEVRATDRAECDRDKLATQEIYYESPGSTPTAFLVLLEIAAARATVTSENGGTILTIEHPEIAATLQMESTGEFFLTNHKTGKSFRIGTEIC